MSAELEAWDTVNIPSYAHQWLGFSPYDWKSDYKIISFFKRLGKKNHLVCARCQYKRKIGGEDTKPCKRHIESQSSGWESEP